MAARAIGLQIQVFNADSGPEIDAAFETMGRERPDAIFVGVSAFLNGRRVQLAQLAAFHGSRRSTRCAITRKSVG